MARTAQTAGLGQKDTYHTQAFTDHAGQAATRVRFSPPDQPIPTNFHTQPVFTFQVYTTVLLNLDEPSTKRNFTASSTPDRTLLTDLIDYLSLQVADNAQRPEPIWEIYTQKGVFECVEHQRREIAYRKAKRDDPSIPPIPKVIPSPYSSDSTGFIIIVDSASFKADPSPLMSENSSQGPLWVYLDRRFPSHISWEPRLRLDGDPDAMDSDFFGPAEPPTILPERVDTTFQRIQRVSEMRSDLGMMYFSSCGPSDPPSLVQKMMDVSWDENEGTPDAERSIEIEKATTTLQDAAARLSISDFTISRPSATDIVISNVERTSEPDLRYVIYIPFLHWSGMEDRLEQAAKAFTHEVTSRSSGKKSISFEFCKPPSTNLSSILKIQRDKKESKDHVGALTTFPNASDEDSEEGSDFIRVHPIARTEHAVENDPAHVDFEPYQTFLIVLERPDFNQVKGGILFLLADGGKLKPSSEEELPPSMRPEIQNYVEMELWRCAGIEEVARRLQMVWGGVRWERGVEEIE